MDASSSSHPGRPAPLTPGEHLRPGRDASAPRPFSDAAGPAGAAESGRPVPNPAGSSSAGPGRAAHGTAHALFFYDVAFGIDLDAAERLLLADAFRERIRHSRKAPAYFEYQPAPLRVTLPAAPIRVDARGVAPAGFETAPQVECRLFDFGAVSIAYRVPIAGPLPALLDLSEALYDNPALNADARRRLDELLQMLAPALRAPVEGRAAAAVEDYVVYQIARVDPFPTPAAAFEADPAFFVQVLRSERLRLAADELSDALSCRISYSPTDVSVIDWNAALLLDADPPSADDARSVLEFANAELLEMRVLDDRLDGILEEAYRTVADKPGGAGGGAGARRRWLPFPVGGARGGGAELRRIAELQMDSALMFEAVNNALKLIGDQYLARVYRLAATRFHLPERDAAIERKLRTLENIYEKMSDRQDNRRMEVLEWIIIILIAGEMLLAFFVRH